MPEFSIIYHISMMNSSNIKIVQTFTEYFYVLRNSHVASHFISTKAKKGGYLSVSMQQMRKVKSSSWKVIYPRFQCQLIVEAEFEPSHSWLPPCTVIVSYVNIKDEQRHFIYIHRCFIGRWYNMYQIHWKLGTTFYYH